MRRYSLYEDNHPSPLPVVLSRKIRDKIKTIKCYNQYNQEAISQWKIYLDEIVSHIEKNSIAFDYSGNSSILLPNKTRFNNELGYGIGYKVMIDANGCAFVFVFMLNLKPEEFGLKVPANLKENKKRNRIRIKESYLRRIIRNILYEQYFIA